MAGFFAFDLFEGVAGQTVKRRVDPLDAALGVGDDDAVGRVMGDEGEAGVGLGDAAQVGVGFAQFARAKADGLLQLRGLFLQARREQEAGLVGILAALVDDDRGFRRAKREKKPGENQREREQGHAVADFDHVKLHREGHESDQDGGHDGEAEEQAAGEGARGGGGQQNLDQFVLRPGQQRAGPEHEQAKGDGGGDLQRMGKGDDEAQGVDEEGCTGGRDDGAGEQRDDRPAPLEHAAVHAEQGDGGEDQQQGCVGQVLRKVGGKRRRIAEGEGSGAEGAKEGDDGAEPAPDRRALVRCHPKRGTGRDQAKPHQRLIQADEGLRRKRQRTECAGQ